MAEILLFFHTRPITRVFTMFFIDEWKSIDLNWCPTLHFVQPRQNPHRLKPISLDWTQTLERERAKAKKMSKPCFNRALGELQNRNYCVGCVKRHKKHALEISSRPYRCCNRTRSRSQPCGSISQTITSCGKVSSVQLSHRGISGKTTAMSIEALHK